MEELDGQQGAEMQERREIICVKIGGKGYSVGDERAPNIVLDAIGVISAPVRVIELQWSDGIRETILPSINDRINFRHKPAARQLIEVPRLDTSRLVV